MEEEFGVDVPRVWVEEELYEEELEVDVPEPICKPFVEEELYEEALEADVPETTRKPVVQEDLYEEEMDVDLSGAAYGEIRRVTVPEVEPEDVLDEEDLGAIVPAIAPQVLLQRQESDLDLEETLLWEERDQEELDVRAPRVRVRILPDETMEDLDPAG